MHWLAKRLFSTNRQTYQQFSTICLGNWETSRVPGRRQLKDSTYFLACINFHIVHCIHFPSFWRTNTAFPTMGSIPDLFCYAGTVPNIAAAYKFHQNIMSFLTFTPWIAMKVQTEHWQWTSFPKKWLLLFVILKIWRAWSIAFVWWFPVGTDRNARLHTFESLFEKMMKFCKLIFKNRIMQT